MLEARWGKDRHSYLISHANPSDGSMMWMEWMKAGSIAIDTKVLSVLTLTFNFRLDGVKSFLLLKLPQLFALWSQINHVMSFGIIYHSEMTSFDLTSFSFCIRKFLNLKLLKKNFFAFNLKEKERLKHNLSLSTRRNLKSKIIRFSIS